jgi:fructose-bisphosphate aldolase class I
MNVDKLNAIARTIVADGRGILAADESTGTITKRFKSVNVESTETSRRDYRETLFSAKGLGKYIGGVIMYDETIRQKAANGTSLVKLQVAQKIIPGIKVDKGTKPLAGSPDEVVTDGLDGLAERVAEYYQIGARFAKWRAVIRIGDHIPTPLCIAANAHALARYARICQEGGLVPIVEPEVLMDGDHDIDRADAVTTETLHTVFHALYEHGVSLEGMLLKPSMVISGKGCKVQASVQEVAERSVRCLRRTVPAAVPGIVFLSGGQSEKVATAHLNAMNSKAMIAKFGPHPWRLSYSYGRALQDSALKTWAGDNKKRGAAQAALLKRAQFNSAAALGRYRGERA